MKKLKKLLLLFMLLATAAPLWADNYYKPTKRTKALESGKQYMIYNTAHDGYDRTFFLYDNGSSLGSNKSKQNEGFIYNESHVWTVEKDETTENLYYIKSNSGKYVGIGGATNNNSKQPLYIYEWTTAPDGVGKSGAQSELEDGTGNINTSDITSDNAVFVITNESKNNYWNGNSTWTTWSDDGHPYAFYEVELVSEEITDAISNFTPYTLQRAFGYIQECGSDYLTGDGDILCNFPADRSQEGSNAYANLTDGNYNTYFHSGYNGTRGDGSAHYLQVALGKNVSEFYFYMKRRHNTNNNRPTKVTISGCNEANGTYTEITTISSGFPTDDANYSLEYFSDKITVSGNASYKYLRFTVNTTNTDTDSGNPFFALSEFYVLPANATVSALFDNYKGNNINITEDDAEAMLNASLVPLNGKKYYIYADTYKNGVYTNRYLYYTGSDLSTSTTHTLHDANYMWTCTVTEDGKYNFQNGSGKYLSHRGISDTAYNFEIRKDAKHAGSVSIFSINANRYMVANDDTGAFNQANRTYNQDEEWCSDYFFVPVPENEYVLNITTSANINATATWNGETKPLPAQFIYYQDNTVTEPTVTINTDNTIYGFDTFYSGDSNTGNTLSVSSLTADASYDVRFTFSLVTGGKYYINADTKQSDNTYVARYIYNSGVAAPATTTELMELCDNFIWIATKDDSGYYTFQNAAGKYLGYGNNGNGLSISDTPVQLDIKTDYAVHSGSVGIMRIGSDSHGKYMVTKADGTAFDRYGNAVNNGSWCSDYIFTPVEEINDRFIVNFITDNPLAECSITWNGETKSLPCTFEIEKDAEGNAIINNNTLTINHNAAHSVDGLYLYASTDKIDYTNGLTIEKHNTYEVRFALDIFSTSWETRVPVLIYNNRTQNYDIRLNTAEDYTNHTVNSGTTNYEANSVWYLIGDESSFKMYSMVAGEQFALKLAGSNSGSAATMVAAADATELTIIKQSDDSYAISPKNTTGQSFNMHGGNGNDIKLYDTSDGGSKWLFKKLNENPLKINAEINEEGALATNTRMCDVAITINGNTSTTTITASNKAQELYLPIATTFAVSHSTVYRGWNIDFNGSDNIEEQVLPTEGIDITVNITADADNKYQYLYYSLDDVNKKPYRIPAIATASNGTVLAVSDYRPCGNDIGFGEVDIVIRRSYDNGNTWSEEEIIADGQGGNSNVFNVGFGDAALVADRESGKVLIMCVAGKQIFSYGNATNHNFMARITSDDNGETWNAPEDVTAQFLGSESSLFPEAHTMFFGSGRIVQSRVIKRGEYYRLYASLLIKNPSNSNASNNNCVLYSDDFGSTWNILGGSIEAGLCCQGGDEPKVEELADGTVILSSRKYYGRYFNVFTFSNIDNNEGSWDSAIASHEATNGISYGGNSCNGEIIKLRAVRNSDNTICDLMLQSIPTGNGRSNVAIYYKEFDTETTYTPTTFAENWTKGLEVSDRGSAYSTMTLQHDGNIGFFYEEDPNGYCMVYVPLSIEEITNEQYSLYNVKMNVSEHQIATFYSNEAVRIPEGVRAFVALDSPNYDEGTLFVTQIENGVIPAKTGAVLKAQEGEYKFHYTYTKRNIDGENQFFGYEGATTNAAKQAVTLEAGYNYYVLAVENETAAFYNKENNFNVSNNRAYLKIKATEASKGLRIVYDREATGISTVTSKTDETIYDLTGRRIDEVTESGLYIVNGEKRYIRK